MINVLRGELFRLCRRPQAWIMPALAVGFSALYYGILSLVHQFGAESDRVELRNSIAVVNVFESGVQIFGFFGTVLMVIVAASLIGSEYSWNTLRPLVARAASRSGLLSAKWVLVVLYTALMVLIGIVGSIVMSMLASLLTDTAISLPSDYWDDYAIGTIRWFVASIPYTVIGFAAALYMRSNAAGIAIGIGVSFVEPLFFGVVTLLSDVLETIQEYGIAWNVSKVTNISMHPEEGPASDFQSPVAASQVWQSAAILGIYVTIIVISSYIVFNRRDITSG